MTDILSNVLAGIGNTLKDAPALLVMLALSISVTGWSYNIIQGNLIELNKNMVKLIENQTKIIERMEDEAEDTEDYVEISRRNSELLTSINARLNN